MMRRLVTNTKSPGPLLLAFSLTALSPTAMNPALWAQPAAEGSAETRIIRGETKNGFSYISGGVGIGERELMRSLAGTYNLELAFAERSGNYLSDVTIVIEDKNGDRIVNITSDGPRFYIQLPSGNYTLKTIFPDGKKRTQDIYLTDGSRAARIVQRNLEPNTATKTVKHEPALNLARNEDSKDIRARKALLSLIVIALMETVKRSP